MWDVHENSWKVIRNQQPFTWHHRAACLWGLCPLPTLLLASQALASLAWHTFSVGSPFKAACTSCMATLNAATYHQSSAISSCAQPAHWSHHAVCGQNTTVSDSKTRLFGWCWGFCTVWLGCRKRVWGKMILMQLSSMDGFFRALSTHEVTSHPRPEEDDTLPTQWFYTAA